MNGKDVLILARTIFGEARGESTLGKIAVAWTVLNRVAAKSWYGDTITEVCRKPWQFSCWNSNDPNRPKLEAVTLNDPDFQHCMYAALAAGLGHVPDPTSGSRHYHTMNVSPDWAQGKSPICSIGVHKFYNDVV
ncbi:MAG: cell wall hydrolase [Alphaproteobacteria bacterium]|nr:cell wall hydrolase [Alphaproteobacteria bacterium]